MIESLLSRMEQGDRLALARLLSLAAHGEGLAEIAAMLPTSSEPARVVAITGSGGVGKSTLVGSLIAKARAHAVKVGVLACDPQSPLSGGALLGDRFRMTGQSGDDGVYIRSLAALSGHGAIADHVDVMIRLLERFGFGLIFVETVGAGQGDVAVHALADTVVLLVQPEAGDDLQWEKAGIFEVADVVVVHKADLPGADRAAAQVRASLDLSSQSQVPVLRVSSRTGEGMDGLWQTLMEQPRRRATERDEATELVREAQALLAQNFTQEKARVQALVEQWRAGKISRQAAVARTLGFLTPGSAY